MHASWLVLLILYGWSYWCFVKFHWNWWVTAQVVPVSCLIKARFCRLLLSVFSSAFFKVTREKRTEFVFPMFISNPSLEFAYWYCWWLLGSCRLLCQDTYEIICFKHGMMLDMTKLGSLIPVLNNLDLYLRSQGFGKARTCGMADYVRRWQLRSLVSMANMDHFSILLLLLLLVCQMETPVSLMKVAVHRRSLGLP